MAGRDGPVIVNVRMPSVMKTMTERYQKKREMPSLSRAIIELLETHPEIRRIEQEMLDEFVMTSL